MKNISQYTAWTAVITPMLDSGEVDYKSLEKLLKRQADAGNGITILGSTGEALNIDESERKQILEFALELKLDTRYMVGVGGINLKSQLAWIEYLETKAVDAYLLVVPLYAKPGDEGQYQWFKALMDTSTRPVCLYNVPGRTCKPLSFKAVEKLKGHKNYWAIKEASGSTEEFKKYYATAPNTHMLSGDDIMLPSVAPLGAKGVVSVAGNVWPEITNKVASACTSGDFRHNDVWIAAASSMFVASNPIPAKAFLAHNGDIESAQVRAPLAKEDMRDIETIIAADRQLQETFN
ncbi:4-hydroxy-tetrahydrodipicolinate synthase [Candidatus Saccharibacteria bacterium]|jgi:4-hydroxy-tetrahydrodipicolinate synthase|nr:4-hydroxy-tetrahydrodipicolinate synthase [Candidatus Saccharibacteria bacterium]